MSSQTFDVAVVGAGPAGCASATALARRGFSVALVDPGGAGFKPGETIPSDVEVPLRSLGAWDAFLAGGHARARASFSAWGSPGLDSRDAFASPAGPGWRLDRRAFDERLADGAEEAGAVRLRGRVAGLEAPSGRGIALALTNGGAVSCEFVVDATGRGGWVSRRMGAVLRRLDGLVAAYATFPRAVPDETNLVEAEAGGWWYAASLPGGRTFVAFFSDADLLRAQGLHRQDAWERALFQTAHARRYAKAPSEGFRVCSAASFRTDSPVGSRWIAVGDAAESWDPLASGGIIQSLRSGLCAADAIEACFGGDLTAVAGYARNVHSLFDRYLRSRAACYDAEARWIGAAFWDRRRSGRPENPDTKLI